MAGNDAGQRRPAAPSILMEPDDGFTAGSPDQRPASRDTQLTLGSPHT